MKTEDDLGLEPPVADGLFTDGGTPDGGSWDGGGPEPTPTPEPIETKQGEKLLRLTMPNGHVYIGKTERALLEQFYKGKIAADQAIADREQQIRTLKATPAPAPAPAPVPAPRAEGEFDGQKYLDLLGQDPMKARRYQDQFYDGAGGSTVTEDPRVKYAYEVAQKVDQQLMAAEFHRRNPDFPASEENGNKLIAIVQGQGLQPNLVNLEWAYGELKRTNQIAPASGEGQPEYEDITFGAPPAPPVRRGRGGGTPPPPRGTGGNAQPDAVDAESMPLDKLREVLRKAGALQF